MVFSLPVIKENGIIELSCEEKLMREKRDILGEEKNRPIRTSVFSNYSVFSLGVHGTFDTNGGLHRAKMKKGKQITRSLKATLESKSQASTK